MAGSLARLLGRVHTVRDVSTVQTALSVAMLEAIGGVSGGEIAGDGFVTVTAHNAEVVVREMLLRDGALSGLEIASPALEDAFLALTQK